MDNLLPCGHKVVSVTEIVTTGGTEYVVCQTCKAKHNLDEVMEKSETYKEKSANMALKYKLPCNHIFTKPEERFQRKIFMCQDKNCFRRFPYDVLSKENQIVDRNRNMELSKSDQSFGTKYSNDRPFRKNEDPKKKSGTTDMNLEGAAKYPNSSRFDTGYPTKPTKNEISRGKPKPDEIQLPCKHNMGKLSIQSSFGNGDTIRCQVCSKHHQLIDIDLEALFSSDSNPEKTNKNHGSNDEKFFKKGNKENWKYDRQNKSVIEYLDNANNRMNPKNGNSDSYRTYSSEKNGNQGANGSNMGNRNRSWNPRDKRDRNHSSDRNMRNGNHSLHKNDYGNRNHSLDRKDNRTENPKGAGNRDYTSDRKNGTQNSSKKESFDKNGDNNTKQNSNEYELKYRREDFCGSSKNDKEISIKYDKQYGNMRESIQGPSKFDKESMSKKFKSNSGILEFNNTEEKRESLLGDLVMLECDHYIPEREIHIFRKGEGFFCSRCQIIKKLKSNKNSGASTSITTEKTVKDSLLGNLITLECDHILPEREKHIFQDGGVFFCSQCLTVRKLKSNKNHELSNPITTEKIVKGLGKASKSFEEEDNSKKNKIALPCDHYILKEDIDSAFFGENKLKCPNCYSSHKLTSIEYFSCPDRKSKEIPNSNSFTKSDTINRTGLKGSPKLFSIVDSTSHRHSEDTELTQNRENMDSPRDQFNSEEGIVNANFKGSSNSSELNEINHEQPQERLNSENGIVPNERSLKENLMATEDILDKTMEIMEIQTYEKSREDLEMVMIEVEELLTQISKHFNNEMLKSISVRLEKKRDDVLSKLIIDTKESNQNTNQEERILEENLMTIGDIFKKSMEILSYEKSIEDLEMYAIEIQELLTQISKHSNKELLENISVRLEKKRNDALSKLATDPMEIEYHMENKMKIQDKVDTNYYSDDEYANAIDDENELRKHEERKFMCLSCFVELPKKRDTHNPGCIVQPTEQGIQCLIKEAIKICYNIIEIMMSNLNFYLISRLIDISKSCDVIQEIKSSHSRKMPISLALLDKISKHISKIPEVPSVSQAINFYKEADTFAKSIENKNLQQFDTPLPILYNSLKWALATYLSATHKQDIDTIFFQYDGLRTQAYWDNGNIFFTSFEAPRRVDKTVCELPFIAIKEIIEHNNCMVFMQVQFQSHFEKIIIDVTEDNAWARQFIQLCTGERKVSYLNTNFFRESNNGLPGHHIWCGQIENWNNPFSDLFTSLPVDTGSPIRAGLVSAQFGYKSTNPMFRIYLQDCDNGKDDRKIGNVVSGMNFLEIVSQNGQSSQLKIVQCGLILSL